MHPVKLLLDPECDFCVTRGQWKYPEVLLGLHVIWPVVPAISPLQHLLLTLRTDTGFPIDGIPLVTSLTDKVHGHAACCTLRFYSIFFCAVLVLLAVLPNLLVCCCSWCELLPPGSCRGSECSRDHCKIL